MPKVCYTEKTFREASLRIITEANLIIEEYQAQGFGLTLRQLYYQFVSRDLLPNTEQSYSRLGSIISDARKAGLIDWEAIEDRTRNIRQVSSWANPKSILRGAALSYRYPLWDHQPYYVEVWIEKDALVGVIQSVCNEYRVPYFSCRGYTSDSEMWAAAQRLQDRGQDYPVEDLIVLHLGDHDPSGMDMTRDITDRLNLYSNEDITVKRIALNMDQIEKYDPPPNPAKITDSRCASYIQKYDNYSWELDALEPTVMSDLIRGELDALIDLELWHEWVKYEIEQRILLTDVAAKWDRVTEFLKEE